MPYIIQEVVEKGKKGYKVCKRDNPSKCFSKHPLPEETARKQRTAIIISELSQPKNTHHKNGGDSKAKASTKANAKNVKK